MSQRSEMCMQMPHMSFDNFMSSVRAGNRVSRDNYIYDFEWDEEKSAALVECLTEIRESADLAGANLVGAKLPRARLRRANLAGADLTAADLRMADMSFAIFTNADLSSANLETADLSGADLSEVIGMYTACTDGVKGVKAPMVMVIFHIIHGDKGGYHSALIESFIAPNRGDVAAGTRYVEERVRERVREMVTEFDPGCTARLHQVTVY